MRKWLPTLALVLCIAALLTAPLWSESQPYLLHMLVLACVLAVPAVGLNLMLGYSGLVSLGSMFHEPVWLFYRSASAQRLAKAPTLSRLAQLKGQLVDT